MEGFNEDALQEVRESRLLLNNLDEWLFGIINPHIGKRVVEIGCGLGNLTSHLLDRELIFSIDISEDAVRKVLLEYSDHNNVLGVPIDITDPSILNHKDKQFDTAISINVFEHIENDVLAMQHAYDLLTFGGQFLLIVPAHMSLYGTMDSSIGHYRRYERSELRYKLESVGFEINIIRHINLLGVFGWFINGRVLRKSVPPRGQLKLFNHLMPFIIWFEKTFHFPFGLSLLVVAKKELN